MSLNETLRWLGADGRCYHSLCGLLLLLLPVPGDIDIVAAGLKGTRGRKGNRSCSPLPPSPSRVSPLHLCRLRI